MANELFGRQARVVFGPIGENGKKVTDLRMRFKVEKTSASSPNKATIDVFNMSQDSRTLSERAGNIITLDAGYQEQLEQVFIGDVARASTKEEGSDFITTFECGDGESAYQNKTTDISFSAGANLPDVLTTLTRNFGLSQGEQSGIPNKSFLNGFVASGPIRSILDGLMDGNDLEWSIQDNQLQIIKKKSTTQEEAIVLKSDSGLIGSPVKKDKGIEVKSLLQPKFKPGRAVVIESKFIKGVFRILKVTHEGDTHDRNWYSSLEVESL